jgi:transposase
LRLRLAIVRDDAVSRRLMTVPSVGPLVAITYKSTMDDPDPITKSKAAGALFGLTPTKYGSGEKDITSGITRAGDEMVRTALYQPANVLIAPGWWMVKPLHAQWPSSDEPRETR